MGRILTGWGRGGRIGRLSRAGLVPVIAALVAFSLVAGPARATLGRQARPGSSGGGGFLTGVACVSGTDCWAAGSRTIHGGQGLAALIEHWDGSAWTPVHVPLPSGVKATVDQGSISCAGPTACWIVGFYTGRTGTLPYAERWNGTSWSAVKLPRPPRTSLVNPIAVSCPSAVRCWVIGASDRGQFTEHWNGRAWSAALMTGISISDNLQRLTCMSDSDCWAVGVRLAGTVAVHWNGHRWSQVRTPTSRSRRQSWVTRVRLARTGR